MPAPAAKMLWQVSHKDEWELLYDRWLMRWEGNEYLQQEFWEIEPGVMIDRRTQKWLEEADEFGILLMSLGNYVSLHHLQLGSNTYNSSVNATHREAELFAGLPVHI